MTPIEHANIDLVQLKNGTPHCKEHGAMNKITPEGIWRCITVTGFRREVNNNVESKIHRETVCRAGCFIK